MPWWFCNEYSCQDMCAMMKDVMITEQLKTAELLWIIHRVDSVLKHHVWWEVSLFWQDCSPANITSSHPWTTRGMSKLSQKPIAGGHPTGKLPDQPGCIGVVWHPHLSLEGASWLCRQGHWGWGGTCIISNSAPTSSRAQLAQPTCLWESGRAAKGSKNLARACWCLACTSSQDAWVLCLALLLTYRLTLGNLLLFSSPHFLSWSKFLGSKNCLFERISLHNGALNRTCF